MHLLFHLINTIPPKIKIKKVGGMVGERTVSLPVQNGNVIDAFFMDDGRKICCIVHSYSWIFGYVENTK